MSDLRDEIFKGIADHSVVVVVVADNAGVIAGAAGIPEQASGLGLRVLQMVEDGCSVREGEAVAKFSGSPKQVATGEDALLGALAKPSGIATATRRFVEEAGKGVRVVSGAWKKMPPSLKDTIRNAVRVGGGHFRIVDGPFVYLDKNYVRMLGGIRNSLQAVAHLEDHQKVVQVKGTHASIGVEASEAAEECADVIFVDTGDPQDIQVVAEALQRKGLRGRVKIAFGGNVRLADLGWLKTMPVDILDIGRPIVDAPLLDMRMEVVAVDGAHQRAAGSWMGPTVVSGVGSCKSAAGVRQES